MIWAKTDSGRAALISGADLTDRTRRSALLAVDGRTAQAALITSLTSSVQGISEAVFQTLFVHGLIAPVAVVTARRTLPTAPAVSGAASPRAVERRGRHRLSSSASLAFGDLSTELTRFIARELGVRGLTLMLALERASTLDELQRVRQIAITRARRKGQSRVAAVSPRLAPRTPA